MKSIEPRPSLPADLDEIAIAVDPRVRAPRRGARRMATGWTWVALGASGALVAVVGLLIALRPSGTSSTANPTSSPPPSATTRPLDPAEAHIPASDAALPAAAAAATDLWESPTSGEPLALRYLPAGLEMIVAVRPRELLAQGEGRKFLTGLGPWARFATGNPATDSPAAQNLNDWARCIPLPPEEIEQLLLGFWEDRAGAVRWALAARATRALTDDDLMPLDLADPRDIAGADVRTRDGLAWWLPSDEQNQVAAIAPVDEMPDVIAAGGVSPRLRDDLASLLATTDQARHLSLLFALPFLTGGGRELLSGPRQQVGDAMLQFLGPRTRAALVSVHFGESWFFEACLSAGGDQPAPALARDLRQRLDAAPTASAEFSATRVGPPTGQPLLARLPLMIDAWREYSRVAPRQRWVCWRSYLPAPAAHNLAWALQLAASPPAATTAPVTAVAADFPAISARLAKNLSLVIPRTTLEGAIELFAQETGVAIEIAGGDLQLEGITKNQSFGLEARDVPAGEALRQILSQASPDGKLACVTRGEPGRESLLVTTLAAALARNDRFAPGFEPSTP